MEDGSDSAATLIGMPGFVVRAAAEDDGGQVWVLVETTAATARCAGCGVRAESKGRKEAKVRDLPVGGSAGGAGRAQTAVAVSQPGMSTQDLDRGVGANRPSGGAHRAGAGGDLPAGRWPRAATAEVARESECAGTRRGKRSSSTPHPWWATRPASTASKPSAWMRQKIRKAGERTAVAGFNLTFSPPKSWSVLWAAAPDEEARQVICDAHHEGCATWNARRASPARGTPGCARSTPTGSWPRRSTTARAATATRRCTPTWLKAVRLTHRSTVKAFQCIVG